MLFYVDDESSLWQWITVLQQPKQRLNKTSSWMWSIKLRPEMHFMQIQLSLMKMEVTSQQDFLFCAMQWMFWCLVELILRFSVKNLSWDNINIAGCCCSSFLLIKSGHRIAFCLQDIIAVSGPFQIEIMIQCLLGSWSWSIWMGIFSLADKVFNTYLHVNTL